MRIIAGKHRSRKLTTLPGDNTRPTLNRVKEAVFSKITNYLCDGIFLDLFSGSGNIALEAISRGMNKAILVDKNKASINIIKANINSLKEDSACVVWNTDYITALDRCKQENLSFKVIYLDPPFNENYLEDILGLIVDYNLLDNNGIIICETNKDRVFKVDTSKIKLLSDKTYGSCKITYFIRS